MTEHEIDDVLLRHLSRLQRIQSVARGAEGSWLTLTVVGPPEALPQHVTRCAARYGLTLALRESDVFGTGLESIFELMTEERLDEVRRLVAVTEDETEIVATPDGNRARESIDDVLPDGGDQTDLVDQGWDDPGGPRGEPFAKLGYRLGQIDKYDRRRQSMRYDMDISITCTDCGIEWSREDVDNDDVRELFDEVDEHYHDVHADGEETDG